MRKVGLSAKGRETGEYRRNSKLTAAQVAEIRMLYAKGSKGCPTLARMFGVSTGNVWLIVKNQTWVAHPVIFANQATDAEAAQIHAMHAAGIGGNTIAHRLGLTRGSVWRVLKSDQNKEL